jgi:hypothetical protein
MTATAFEHVPRTRQGHFLLHFFAALQRLLHYISRLQQLIDQDLQESLTRFPFLRGYLVEIERALPAGQPWEDAAGWWEREIGAWEQTIDQHLPLRAVDELSAAGFEGRLALLCAGLVDEDSRFGTLLAHFQEPLPYRRPCLETVGHIMGQGRPGVVDAWNLCRSLVQAGLLEVVNRDAPRAEWLLRVPNPLWDVLRGTDDVQPERGCELHPPHRFSPLEELIFPAEYLEQLAEIPPLLLSGRIKTLVVRGTPGSERLDVLGAIASAAGWGVAECVLPVATTREGGEPEERRYPYLGPLCTLTRSLPVLTYELGPGESIELQPLAGYHGPTAVFLGMEGGIRGPLAENALTLSLPTPGADLRLRHWRRVLDGQAGPELQAISERFRLPGGYIRQAATLALTQAALGRRERISLSDVRLACRTLNRQLLDSLATRQEAEGSWADLVVNPMTALKLRELELRCRHRERLPSHLGRAFHRSTGCGVRALFTGGSGAGKTLAARILAAELGMDLYRVDLSAVINKYIGETEKNLHRVLSRAEELDVILLLDEGDSLLGNRTEVKSSNDRYANLETNYLLQRLESYQGIVLVTTNAGQNIDSAFQRRMDVVVHFTPAGPEERLRIWELHLPADHAVDPLSLEAIAVRHTLSGGQIRNAALHATLLALDDGGVVDHWHVEAALASEYRKAGALFPVLEEEPNEQQPATMEAFLNLLSSPDDPVWQEPEFDPAYGDHPAGGIRPPRHG